MAAITTKFGIGDVFYVFNSETGVFTRHVVSGIVISSVGSGLQPEITYQSSKKNYSTQESDCLSEVEARDVGNAWIADKALTMFTSVGL